jgi:hypothetical protein
VTADHYVTDNGEERNTPVFFADWVKIGNMASAGYEGDQDEGQGNARANPHAMPDDNVDDGW